MFTVFVYLINVLLVERRCINNAKLMMVSPLKEIDIIINLTRLKK